MLLLLLLFFTAFAILAYRRFSYTVGLFFFLLPTYLIRFSIGPLPTTLLEGMFWIIFMIWLFSSSQAKRSEVEGSEKSNVEMTLKQNKLLSLGIILFLLGATISLFTSSDLRSALGEWKAFYVEPILVSLILITSALKLQQKDPTTILQFCNSSILFPLILSGLITSIFAIFQHFTGFFVPHAFWANGESYRVTAWYGFPNAVGLFLAPLIPLALHLVCQNWDQKNRIKELRIKEFFNSSILQFYVPLLFLITAPLAIIFSKSTGSLIGLLAGIGTLLLFYKKTRLLTLGIGIIAVVTVIFMSNNALKQELLAQNRSGQIRMAIWSETVQLLKDHPVLGAGLASYSEKIKPYHRTVNGEGIEIFHHPHNIFLTMWVNTGLIGLTGFVLILIWFFYRGFQKLKEDGSMKLKIFLIASMTTILVSGLVDSPYIKNDLSVFFWLLIALMAQEKPVTQSTS